MLSSPIAVVWRHPGLSPHRELGPGWMRSWKTWTHLAPPISPWQAGGRSLLGLKRSRSQRKHPVWWPRPHFGTAKIQSCRNSNQCVFFVSDYQKPSLKTTSPSAPTSPPWRLCLKAASPAGSQSGVFVCLCPRSVSLLYSQSCATTRCYFVCRFSTEDLSSSPEKKNKPASSTSTSTRHRSSADWLGLKVDDHLDFLGGDQGEAKSTPETPKSASPPLVERGASASAAAADASGPAGDGSTVRTKPEVSRSQEKEEEEDDWLAGVLGRKKAQSASNSENKLLRREEPSGPLRREEPSGPGSGEEVDLESLESNVR